MRRKRVEEPWLSLILSVGLIVVGLVMISTATDRSAVLLSSALSASGLGLLVYYFIRRRIWETSLTTFP